MELKERLGPMRTVIDWQEGAGCDRLQLECGHAVIRNHRSSAPKRARCPSCQAGAKPSEVERLQARIEALEGALQVFAVAWDEEEYLAEAHWSDFQNARSILSNKGDSDDAALKARGIE